MFWDRQPNAARIIERAMHHAINWHISLHQRFADRRADESFYIAGHAGAASTRSVSASSPTGDDSAASDSASCDFSS